MTQLILSVLLFQMFCYYCVHAKILDAFVTNGFIVLNLNEHTILCSVSTMLNLNEHSSI